MILTIILIIFYLVGAVLSYGKILGAIYEISESFPTVKPSSTIPIIFISLLSWLTFIAALLLFFMRGDRYFFKWSKKDLLERYYLIN